MTNLDELDSSLAMFDMFNVRFCMAVLTKMIDPDPCNNLSAEQRPASLSIPDMRAIHRKESTGIHAKIFHHEPISISQNRPFILNPSQRHFSGQSNAKFWKSVCKHEAIIQSFCCSVDQQPLQLGKMECFRFCFIFSLSEDA